MNNKDEAFLTLAVRLLELGDRLLGQAEAHDQDCDNWEKTVHPIKPAKTALLLPCDRKQPSRLEMSQKESDDMDRAMVDQLLSGVVYRE